MPNLIAVNNPVQAGFLGDYMWVDTDSHNDAHIVWADTRPIRGTAPEEDIYYAEVKQPRELARFTDPVTNPERAAPRGGPLSF